MNLRSEVSKLQNLILASTAAQFLMFQGGEKTMKNRCQNHVNIELQLDSNLGPILEGLGSQVGAQVEAKMHPKPIEKSIVFLINFEVFWGGDRS